jgi:copper chaperone CopZ
MKNASKNWALLVVGVGITAIGYIWLSTTPTAQVDSPNGNASAAVPAPTPSQKKVVLKNLGMSCPFCKAAVSAKLKQLPGVIVYEVDVKSDSATVLYDPAKVTIEKIKQAIAEAGFQVRAVEEVGQ